MTEVTLDENQLGSLEGKVAIVTGGASGIGRKLVELLIKKNATVVFCDINTAAGEQVLQEQSSNAKFIKCDILNWSELQDLFVEAKKLYGHVDLVYANAGIVTGLDAFEDKLDENGRLLAPDMSVIDVCLKSVVTNDWTPNSAFEQLTTRAASKLALSFFKSNPTPGGQLILTSSAAGYNPRPNIVLYSAAKTGVAGLLRALHQFVGHNSDITVNSVAPGPTATSMFDADAIAQAEKMGLTINTPDFIALGQVFLAGQQGWNGKCLTLIGGKATEVEDSLEKTRMQWYGKYNTDMARMAQTINYDYKR